MSEAIRAQIESITPLTDSILQLVLVPEHYIDYQAGQYLEIVFANQTFCYSIANASLGSHKYELHIRHVQGDLPLQQLLADIKQRGEVTLRLPRGDCYLKKLYPDKPILFIAGGTGFAPIKAMIEQLLATNDTRNFELFWGARSQSDLYMNEKVSHWQAHVARFRYFSLLSEGAKHNLISLILDKHALDLKAWQFVIGGPFDLVYATRDILIAQGVPPEYLFSDAFSFEKKGEK